MSEITERPDFCPNCGAAVPETARACPECGSCEETGWSERATAQRLDLPDDEFDYDDYVKQEFGPPAQRAHGASWLWWLAAILLSAAFLLGLAW